MENKDLIITNSEVDDTDRGFLVRHFKLISLIACLIVLILGGFLVFRSVSSPKNSKIADEMYKVYEKYYAINEDSPEQAIYDALTALSDGEQIFSSNPAVLARINFYKADLYNRLSDSENRIISLEKVLANAKKNNFILPISIYNLAIIHENKGQVEKACEYYERLYNTYKGESLLSSASLFALYRIYNSTDIDKANKYKSILEDEFQDSEYTKFLQSIGR